jgi:hypothetical protein
MSPLLADAVEKVAADKLWNMNTQQSNHGEWRGLKSRIAAVPRCAILSVRGADRAHLDSDLLACREVIR